ncbi:MAG: NAD(+) synthase [Victivallales bacterium]|nr:NAD(+) synthase [Victivallales bacterium]
MPIEGLYRIAAVVPRLHLGDPAANAEEILAAYNQAVAEGASIVVTPELSLTGSTCGDLFRQNALLHAAIQAVSKLRKGTEGKKAALVVGLPVRSSSNLYNCAAIVQNGKIGQIIGKKHLSNAKEKLLFTPLSAESKNSLSLDIIIDGESYTLLHNQEIFASNNWTSTDNFAIGIEIGSEADAPNPPATSLATHAAQLIINPMAEMETGDTWRQRKTQVCAQSTRLKCAYVSVGAGTGESTADGVFAGYAVAAVNGTVVAESPRFSIQTHITYFDFIPRWLDAERTTSQFHAENPSGLVLPEYLETVSEPTYLHLQQNPFVPGNEQERATYFDNLLAITATALARRMEASRSKRLVIGLSGGLDSTLALVTCANACDLLGLKHDAILAITMPGMGTSGRTKNNAVGLANALGAELREISIRESVLQHFKDIDHPADNLNVVYENAQARERTQILMDIANEVNGLVVGTGDLSEIAQGWCTYNGDQMAMYGVNAAITKTVIRQLVEYIASKSDTKLATHLRDVNATPVSPELLPGEQHTESIIGNYDLHDFFLYHFIKHAELPENIYQLACYAFKGIYSEEKIRALLKTFFRRFFTQQFKRNASPDAPKIGPVSLGARGDWQMPDDTAFTPWIIE